MHSLRNKLINKMNKIVHIVISLLLVNNCYSQNDTLYLECDHIVLNGKIINNTNKEGKKEGEWKEFDFTESRFEIWYSMGSGDNIHIYSTLHIEYRPLSKNEYYGMYKMTSKSSDSIEGVKYIHEEGIEFRNKIPTEHYYIASNGIYQNDQKEGKWNYYYSSGTLIKSIIYEKGIPVKSYKIYAENGKIKAKMKRKNRTTWTAIQYSPEGKKLWKITNEVKHFKMLY